MVKKDITGLTEPKECCFSCLHFKRGKGRVGTCVDGKYPGKDIKYIYTTCCDCYSEIELIQCDICKIYVRSLGNHVKAHGITAAEYKEQYGINRTTGLVCSATKERLKEFALEVALPKLMASDNFRGNHGTSTKGYKMRDEAKINMRLAKKEISEETRKRMSEANKGKNKGKTRKFTETHKANIAKATRFRLKEVGRTIVRDEKGRFVNVIEDKDKYNKYIQLKKEVKELTSIYGMKYVYKGNRHDGVPQYIVKITRDGQSKYFSTSQYGEIGALIQALKLRNKLIESKP